MPKGRFAELSSEVDRAAFRRRRRRCLYKEKPVIGRNAMSRQPSNSQRKPARKARPVLEGLEDRQLLSSGPAGGAIEAAPLAAGVFSHHHRQFQYLTPTGGRAVIVLQGIGNLTGTYIDGMGLHIEYADTNSFSKIIGQVYKGNGTAPLASIYNRHLVEAGAQNSLSGVGGNVLQAVILNDWDLVAGGTINLTSGVNSLVLNSIGADTQIHLRELPAALEPTALVANAQAVAASPSSSSGSSSSSSHSGSSSSGSSGSGSSSSGVTPTLPVGVSTPITNSNGTTWTYILEKKQDLTLTGVGGSFTAGKNVVEQLPAGQPPQTQPPAPPGIILQANTIDGNPPEPINLLTDSVIWGYDAKTGRLVQFSLSLANPPGPNPLMPTPYGTGYPDGVKITVPGDPSVVGLNLGWDGNQLDVLVSSPIDPQGNPVPTVYAYNATTGDPDLTGSSTGSFSTANLMGPGQVISIGSTDTVTVLGSYDSVDTQYNNQLQMIDLAASLQSGIAQPAAGSPATFSPPTAQTTFLGGLTSVPGSTTIYGTVAAHFDTFQPDMFQLGIESANTVKVKHDKKKGSQLTYKFGTGSASAVTSMGTFTNVLPNPLVTGQPGPALGSVDSNLALGIPRALTPGTTSIVLLNPSTSAPVETINLYSDKSLTAPYAHSLVALSGTFRPDLYGSATTGTGPALIDIQGDVQSIRGNSATGMVLNDSGNLNLVKFTSLSDSTIVGQPLGHVVVSTTLVDKNVTMLTPSRTVETRGGVQVVGNLQQIGPLSLTGDQT